MFASLAHCVEGPWSRRSHEATTPEESIEPGIESPEGDEGRREWARRNWAPLNRRACLRNRSVLLVAEQGHVDRIGHDPVAGMVGMQVIAAAGSRRVGWLGSRNTL